MLVIDSTGHIALANAHIEKLWNMNRQDLVGQNMAELVKRPSLGLPAKLGFTTGELLELLINLSQNLDIRPSRQTYPLDDRYIERSGTPVIGENKRVIGWVMVLRDVTEEKQIAITREELTNMVVHDLRTPLTSMLASLKLIEEMSRDHPEAAIVTDVLDVSLRSSKKMILLVDSLLDIFKTESGRMELKRAAAALHNLAGHVVEDLSSLAQQQEIRLINTVAADLPLISIDAEKIERVFTNLADNALKFTPPHGSIALSARLFPDPAAPECILCEVADTGPGIPDDYRAHIFDRFVQVSGREGRRRGVGLGLAFCRMAVEAHGGRIWVENRPEGGSLFKFTLPLSLPKT
jgi:signal transduction histidine kinase